MAMLPRPEIRAFRNDEDVIIQSGLGEHLVAIPKNKTGGMGSMFRTRRVYETDALNVKLSYYGPGLGMGAHSHDFDQVSFLLGGGLSEGHGGTSREMHQRGIGLKPAGFEHDNRYHGRDGALILSINLRPGADAALAGLGPDDWHWSPDAPPDRMSELHALLAADGDAAGDAVVDLLARLGPGRKTHRTSPPAWLRRIRDRLDDPADLTGIAAIAEEAGVHRVYLARVFAAHYGVAPTAYRLQRRVGRAVGLLATGSAPGDAAAEAGFADQAHMTRCLRRQTGLTPGGLRRFLLAA